jgi:hypothetical protein
MKMTFDEFKASLTAEIFPSGLSKPLQALWEEAKGDWNRAHQIAQSIEDEQGAWVHAYLHRKEGDSFNANYWYARANQSRPNLSFPEEWEKIVQVLLKIQN